MAFSTSISGLKAASTDLNVIGNNIANSGTTGFKQSRAEFADVYAASNLGAGSNTPGAGVRVASVSQQFGQGTISFTNNNLDLAVSGEGFFRMSSNGASVYTRAGAFGVDRNGFIVNSSGMNLTGYLADAAGNITGAIGNLQISKADIAPSATANMSVGVNLDASAAPLAAAAFDPNDPTTYHSATSTTVYDSLGNTHLASMYFVRTAVAPPTNDWSAFTFIDGQDIYGTGGMPYTGDTLSFDNAGALTAGGTVAYPAFALTNGAGPLTMTMNFGQSTQFGSPFGVNSLSQDGYTTGRLASVDIDQSGVVFARYTNGQSRAQGQVVLSNFANPQGLQNLGNTTWGETAGSGVALTGAPSTASLGVLQSGALEDSNVELSEQLVKMIIAQRNFQANAQVITAEDTVTQTIINLR